MTVFFVEYWIPTHAAALPALAPWLLKGGKAILDFLGLCKASPRVPPPGTVQELVNHGLCHLRCARASGVPFGPKHHLFLHLLNKIPVAGNPVTYHTFLDESLNRTLATIAKSANYAVWEDRIFAYFSSLSHRERGAAVDSEATEPEG